MLSPLFFSTFADVEPRVIRLAVRLIRDFELTRFRVLSLYHISEHYGEGMSSFDVLIQRGFLERGPNAKLNRKKGRFACHQTYRIRPAFLMRPKDLAAFFAERQLEEHRLAIAPVRLHSSGRWYEIVDDQPEDSSPPD